MADHVRNTWKRIRGRRIVTEQDERDVATEREKLEKDSMPRTQPIYPYADGDVTVLGPEIFAAEDGSVLSWKGENYVRQESPPSQSGEGDDARLVWVRWFEDGPMRGAAGPIEGYEKYVPAAVGLTVEEAEHATDLAERYGDAIARISEHLNNAAIHPHARIIKARLVIAGLDTAAVSDGADSGEGDDD